MDVKKAYAQLLKAGYTPAGACGVIGNLQHESGLRGNNLENAFNKKFDMTDEEYTDAVDRKAISREDFMSDCAGYGLAQWTWHTRKAALWDRTVKKGLSISDEKTQLDFFVTEVYSTFPAVYKVLTTTNSVKAASDIVLTDFERPADTSDKSKNYRASLGQKVFDAMMAEEEKKNARKKKALEKSKYYEIPVYNGNSIVDGLKAINVDSRYQNRMLIAQANGIENYLGLGNQNIQLLKLLKAGLLIIPKN